MFSALKRLTKSESENANHFGSSDSKYAPMSAALQKKFSKGVQYNMKIVLKGDHNSGKTSLFRRLQGQPFVEEYTPTDEIQVTNIHWNYKTHDDVVKVEVWDVVDKAKSKKQFQGKLKIANSKDAQEEAPEVALDATFLDVYKNANGVILLFDITKPWTYDYVKREVTAIPKSIPTLILGNHRDMGHNSKTVSYDTAQYFVDALNEEEDCQRFRYAESSMKDGFGLKLIHKFFNLPFLQLQKDTLLKQLESNREESSITLQELDLYYESPEANYSKFIEQRTGKAAGDAVNTAPTSGPPPPTAERRPSFPQTQGKPMPPSPAQTNLHATTNATSGQPPTRSEASPTPPRESRQSETSRNGATPALSTSTTQVPSSQGQGSAPQTTSSASGSPKKKPTMSEALAFDFLPDESEELDNSFFRDENTNTKPSDNGNKRVTNDSSDEEQDNNPMVMSYVEDIAVDQYSTSKSKRPVIPKQVSSSEDET